MAADHQAEVPREGAHKVHQGRAEVGGPREHQALGAEEGEGKGMSRPDRAPRGLAPNAGAQVSATSWPHCLEPLCGLREASAHWTSSFRPGPKGGFRALADFVVAATLGLLCPSCSGHQKLHLANPPFYSAPWCCCPAWHGGGRIKREWEGPSRTSSLCHHLGGWVAQPLSLEAAQGHGQGPLPDSDKMGHSAV